jgi:hypothetical protein
VTSFTQVNVYVYTPRLLLISWGVAIFYTLVAVLLGFLALVKNGYSYSNNFSTVLRTTRHVDIDALLHPASKTGADPLPKTLTQRNLTLKSHTGSDSDLFQSENDYGLLNGTQNSTHIGNGKTLAHMSEIRMEP